MKNRENHSWARANGICSYRLWTTGELIHGYIFESDRINAEDREITQKSIKKELRRRFNRTLRLLDKGQCEEDANAAYLYLLGVDE